MDTQHFPDAQSYAANVISRLGGTAATARLCKTSMAAISQWKREGIPDYRLDFLKLARPDVFEGLEEPSTPSPTEAGLERH